MGLFGSITKRFFGRQSDTSDVTIIDGEIISLRPFGSGFASAPAKETEMKMEEPDDLFAAYKESLSRSGKKKRTVSEYFYDVKSFSEADSVDALTVQQIEKRLENLKPPTRSRKLAALKSFATWRLSCGSEQLYLTLAHFGLSQKQHNEVSK